MNPPSVVGSLPLPTPAVPASARAKWMLLALLPGVAVTTWVFGTGFAIWIAGVLSILSLADIVAERLAGPTAAWNPTPLLMAALALCWLPASCPRWMLAAAGGLAWACARIFGRHQGGSAFHPAMIGCALPLVFHAGQPVIAASDASSLWIAMAYAAAGITLAIGRCVRWQVALATWLGGAAASSFLQALGWRPPAQGALDAILPTLQVAIFFIATDPSSGCQSPRARWAFGAGIGVLAKLALLGLHDGSRVFLGMAGAVLLMNAAAPWLDRMLPPVTARTIRNA